MTGQAVQLMTSALSGSVDVPERTVTSLESYPPIEKLSRMQTAASKQ
jgi:hypothetical protein